MRLSAQDGVRHVVQILAGGTLGLPTTADQDKLLALPRAATSWPGPPVTFTTYKFLKTLGLHPRSGKHYREVRTWVDRLAATTIISERGVRVAGQWRYQRERLHLVTRAVSVGERLPDGQLAEENHIWFAGWFYQNIKAGHTLEIDLDWYLRLRLPLARTLALPFGSGFGRAKRVGTSRSGGTASRSSWGSPAIPNGQRPWRYWDPRSTSSSMRG